MKSIPILFALEFVLALAGTDLPAVTICDDVQNLGHPSPWYVNQEMPF